MHDKSAIVRLDRVRFRLLGGHQTSSLGTGSADLTRGLPFDPGGSKSVAEASKCAALRSLGAVMDAKARHCRSMRRGAKQPIQHSIRAADRLNNRL